MKSSATARPPRIGLGSRDVHHPQHTRWHITNTGSRPDRLLLHRSGQERNDRSTVRVARGTRFARFSNRESNQTRGVATMIRKLKSRPVPASIPEKSIPRPTASARTSAPSTRARRPKNSSVPCSSSNGKARRWFSRAPRQAATTSPATPGHLHVGRGLHPTGASSWSGERRVLTRKSVHPGFEARCASSPSPIGRGPG